MSDAEEQIELNETQTRLVAQYVAAIREARQTADAKQRDFDSLLTGLAAGLSLDPRRIRGTRQLDDGRMILLLQPLNGQSGAVQLPAGAALDG